MAVVITYLENGEEMNIPLFSLLPGKNRGDIIC